MCHFSSSIEMQLKKKKRRRRNALSRKTALFEKCGPKLQGGPHEALEQKELNSELNDSPMFLLSERLRLWTIQGALGPVMGWGEPTRGPHDLRAQSPRSHWSQVWSSARNSQDSCFSCQNRCSSQLGLSSVFSKQLCEPQKPKETPGVGETPFLSDQMKTARDPHSGLLLFSGSPKENSYQS